jgi:hypothetical protein
MKTYGNRRQVYAKLAKRTRAGLTRKDLALNRAGKVVSRKKQKQKSNLGTYLQTKRKSTKN